MDDLRHRVLILLFAASFLIHAVWGLVSGLLLNTPAAAVWLFLMQVIALEVLVDPPQARVRDWVFGVMLPFAVGTAAFLVVRGQWTPTPVVTFATTAAAAHVLILVVKRAARAFYASER